MTALVFSAVLCIMVVIASKAKGNVVNTVTVLALPYIVIAPINNLVMVRYGFYSIEDEVFLMLAGGIGLFFLGSVLVDANRRFTPEGTDECNARIANTLSLYDLSAMRVYAIVVELLGFARFALLILDNGFSYIGSSDFEGAVLSGPVGHVILTLYGVVPILFLYWLRHKRQYGYLVVTLGAVGLLFLSMVKYHAIGMLVVLYFFVALEDRRYLKKGALILVAFAIGLFIANYALGFFAGGVYSQVSSDYYLNHLWNYISGSLIYDNHIFAEGVRVGVDVFYKMGSFLCGLPNMFLRALFDIGMFEHETLAHLPVSTTGETGNVVDAIGYLFPSHGGVLDVCGFAVVMLLLGIVMTAIYNKGLRAKAGSFRVTTAIFLTFFLFFSFFGTFYINATPWEILVWSAIVPTLFNRERSPLRRPVKTSSLRIKETRS